MDDAIVRITVLYRIGTRKSDLALTQTNWVKRQLESQGLSCELVLIESQGDKEKTKPLYQIETTEPGLFTKQLEQALLEKRVDIAVHSLKDLPTLQPDELFVACIPERERTNDVLIKKTSELKPGAKVGTSSLRREALLLCERPDLEIHPLRGNVPTRVKSVLDGKLDAIVLAAAGLNRLKFDLSTLFPEELSIEDFVPAPGQGALGIEVRKDSDPALLSALKQFHHAPTAEETRIERRILRLLEGGCTLPLGVRCVASPQGNEFRVLSFLGLCEGEGNRRRWKGFERFDISGAEPETLVDQTVTHFRKWMEGKGQ